MTAADKESTVHTLAEEFIYDGADLDSMDRADNYHDWIVTGFGSQLTGNIVEVGAGIGSFSRLIAERPGVERMLLIEPSAGMAAQLIGNADEIALPTEVCNGFLAGAAERVREFEPQTMVYVNVFEHVEDDVGELERIYDLLPSGGALCVFVPALSWLYSDFDRSIDHFRRYSKRDLSAKARAAGFEVERLRYFDFFGILPWLVKFRLLRSTNLNPGAITVYDRLVVPVARRLESLIAPPVGKNLLMVARKP